MKNILVGYDGSLTAQRAFLFALELARCSGGHVRVVSVLQITDGGADTAALMMADVGAQRLGDLMAELKQLAPDADKLIDLEMIPGNPGDVLLRQVKQYAIDHIVIGHTERGALARWLLGSVSTDVFAHTRIPVTVVP